MRDQLRLTGGAVQQCATVRSEEDKDNAAILKCLVSKVDVVNDSCARQVSRSVRSALSFYQPVSALTPSKPESVLRASGVRGARLPQLHLETSTCTTDTSLLGTTAQPCQGPRRVFFCPFSFYCQPAGLLTGPPGHCPEAPCG